MVENDSSILYQVATAGYPKNSSLPPVPSVQSLPRPSNWNIKLATRRSLSSSLNKLRCGASSCGTVVGSPFPPETGTWQLQPANLLQELHSWDIHSFMNTFIHTCVRLFNDLCVYYFHILIYYIYIYIRLLSLSLCVKYIYMCVHLFLDCVLLNLYSICVYKWIYEYAYYTCVCAGVRLDICMCLYIYTYIHIYIYTHIYIYIYIYI